MIGEEPVVCWQDRLGLGEGIRAVDGGIVLVDILTGRLLAGPTDRAAPLTQVAGLSVPLGAVAPVHGRPHTWIAAAGTGICLILPDGRTEWLARPEDGAATAMRMNDATADPQGRFWAGSMGYGAEDGAGSLYRIDHDGTVIRVLDGLTVPNGPAFCADGTVMYLADSAKGVIRRYPVDPDTGLPGTPDTFAVLDHGSPDGMTVDAEEPCGPRSGAPAPSTATAPTAPGSSRSGSPRRSPPGCASMATPCTSPAPGTVSPLPDRWTARYSPCGSGCPACPLPPTDPGGPSDYDPRVPGIRPAGRTGTGDLYR